MNLHGIRKVSRMLKPRKIHNSLDEYCILPNVGILALQFGKRAEERTPTGDVHFAYGTLKGRGGYIRSEGINDVFPIVLVQQHQGHLPTTIRLDVK